MEYINKIFKAVGVQTHRSKIQRSSNLFSSIILHSIFIRTKGILNLFYHSIIPLEYLGLQNYTK